MSFKKLNNEHRGSLTADREQGLSASTTFHNRTETLCTWALCQLYSPIHLALTEIANTNIPKRVTDAALF